MTTKLQPILHADIAERSGHTGKEAEAWADDVLAKAWQEYDASFMPSQPPTPWLKLPIEHAWTWIGMAEAILRSKRGQS
jgi:hypothetical protein